MNRCHNCNGEVTAEIKSIMLDKQKLERPVWYCHVCDLSTPVKTEDRYSWVDSFEWTSSFIYGLESSCNRCLGCERDGTMYAEVEHTLGGAAFPFHTILHPSWTCYICGFTDLALREHRYKWSNAYHLWA